ncbi:hypothetical protein L248_2137 [Schleiferilactobacillus shenzhenensis LY-73]|uniref:Uncharacterized protein n=1 Tax=Schleiferilactobacillus shenzhenensis LY-73 TaxID=1231336 RepID=U4TI65_9LACO|nr:hypothetical protein L248_2137 [Schleiferilactobacillus shenzhenensis LY-73]
MLSLPVLRPTSTLSFILAAVFMLSNSMVQRLRRPDVALLRSLAGFWFAA